MNYAYGSRNYSQGLYGGLELNSYLLRSIPAVIEVYNSALECKATYQLGCGYFLGCSFKHTKSGAGDFILEFARIVNIDKKDIVKIKLFNSLDYFFTGVIRKVPIQGSTTNNYQYSGLGLNDYLLRLNAGSLSFANKTIFYIVDYLLDNIIISNTPITRNDLKIDCPDITLVSFEINYSSIDEVIRTLLDIANSIGNYYSGVDKDGDFFFLPESNETKKTLIVGAKGNNGIDNYEPNDVNEPRTKYFTLDKDGAYVATISSDLDYDVYEEKLTAPDIDNTAIEAWAEGILLANEQLIRNASIRWKIEETEPLALIADGYIRILSNTPPSDLQIDDNFFGQGNFGADIFGGEQYSGYNLDETLRVMEVIYNINNDGAVREIQLGSLPVRFDEEFYTIKKNLTDLRISLGR